MNTKISKIALSVTIGLLSFAPNALALKRAPFPNSTSLQPIPVNVQPNISGNVNSDLTSAPASPEQAPVAEPVQATPSPEQTGLRWYSYVGFLAGFLLAFLIKYLVRRRNQSK